MTGAKEARKSMLWHKEPTLMFGGKGGPLVMSALNFQHVEWGKKDTTYSGNFSFNTSANDDEMLEAL